MSEPELLRREAKLAFEAAQQVSLLTERQGLLAMSEELNDQAREIERLQEQPHLKDRPIQPSPSRKRPA
jgi:hypothetical protein